MEGSGLSVRCNHCLRIGRGSDIHSLVCRCEKFELNEDSHWLPAKDVQKQGCVSEFRQETGDFRRQAGEFQWPDATSWSLGKRCISWVRGVDPLDIVKGEAAKPVGCYSEF